jgi:teichuronic acid exporter
MTLKTEMISGLKWTAGGKFGGQIITWGITIVVMRLLEPSDYGLLAMASVFVAFLLMMSEIGLGPALIQKVEISTETLNQAFGVILTVNATLLILLNLLAGTIAEFFGDDRLVPIIRTLSLQFPLIALTVIPEVLLQRGLKFRNRSLIDLSSAVVSSIVTLSMALAHYGVWSLVIGNLVGSGLKAVAVNGVSPFLPRPSFSWHGMRDLFRFGGNVTFSRMLWFFFSQADAIIVGRVLGKEVLGLYSVAMHLASLPVQRVSAILNQVAFPAVSRFQGDKDIIRDHLLKVLGLLSLFAFPVLWGISSSADEIVLVFLGHQWERAALPLQLLALIMPLRMQVTFLSSITDGLGRPELGLHNVLLGCLVMPAAFYVGSNWGLTGIALAWVTAYPLVVLFNVRRMIAVMGLRVSEVARTIAPSVLAAGGMYIMVLAAQLICRNVGSRVGALVVQVAVGMISYVVLSYFLNRTAFTSIVRRITTK